MSVAVSAAANTKMLLAMVLCGFASASAQAPQPDASTFVGGYTVSGTSIATTIGADGRVSNQVAAFAVDQECICGCNATVLPGAAAGARGDAAAYNATTFYCLGANDGNAFSAVAYEEEQQPGRWTVEQSSINGAVNGANYHAVFTFLGDDAAGGAHTAQGHTFPAPGAAATTTQFRAVQSAIGCHEGVGAAKCLPLCARYGIDARQLRAKCDL